MLLPLIGFITGVSISSLLGIVVIIIHPKWKLRFINVVLFVIGSLLTTLLSSYIYTKLFADNNGVLQSTELVLGNFGLIVFALIGGGITSTYLGRIFLKMD